MPTGISEHDQNNVSMADLFSF